MGWFLSTLCFLALHRAFVSGAISCKDQDGNDIDWSYMYKLPRLHESPHPMVQDGLGYFYMDKKNPSWAMGDSPLNTTSHSLYHTTQQIYDNYKSESVVYLLYNDETPEKNVSYTNGHTKGVVIYDDVSGIWLVHSLPRFPQYANKAYEYPPSGVYYGQAFLCMTLPYSTLDDVVTQLLYTHPQVYDYNVPQTFAEKHPDLVKVANDEHVTSSPWQRKQELVTVEGQAFFSYAKYSKFHADLYDAWVAPDLGSDLAVETWRRPTVLPTNCSAKYKVYNIDEIQIDDVAFKYTEDHSKWAITLDSALHWVCVGDINRMVSQEKRPGGTVCGNLKDVWSAFNATDVKREPCPAKDVPKPTWEDPVPNLNVIL